MNSMNASEYFLSDGDPFFIGQSGHYIYQREREREIKRESERESERKRQRKRQRERQRQRLRARKFK